MMIIIMTLLDSDSRDMSTLSTFPRLIGLHREQFFDQLTLLLEAPIKHATPMPRQRRGLVDG